MSPLLGGSAAGAGPCGPPYQQATPDAGIRQEPGASPCPPKTRRRRGPERTRKVTVRMSEGELAALRAHVARTGWSLEAYVRSVLAGAVPPERPPEAYLEMARELRSIGTNLNQIARKAHAIGAVDAGRYDAEARRLERALIEIVAAVKSPGRR